jgi:hypothetical protein
MEIKVRFKAIKYHGGSTTFVETIDVPDDLTTVEEQDDFINDLDKSDIMDNHNLYGIIDFFRYVKKPRGEKKPTWKSIAKQWETNYNTAIENVEFWKNTSNEWKEIALKYRKFIETKFGSNDTYFKTPDKEDKIETKENSVDTGLPVDITKNYSGGWLDPNGDFYGMDGDYINMIHAQLGDKLLELGLIPKEKDGFHNPDSWLCDNGWVKIHYDWINYDGYLKAKRSDADIKFNTPIRNAIPMTDEQRKKIVLYGKLCCGGILKFGLQKTQISAVRFEMTESPMIWKLFDY